VPVPEERHHHHDPEVDQLTRSRTPRHGEVVQPPARPESPAEQECDQHLHARLYPTLCSAHAVVADGAQRLAEGDSMARAATRYQRRQREREVIEVQRVVEVDRPQRRPRDPGSPLSPPVNWSAWRAMKSTICAKASVIIEK